MTKTFKKLSADRCPRNNQPITTDNCMHCDHSGQTWISKEPTKTYKLTVVCYFGAGAEKPMTSVCRDCGNTLKVINSKAPRLFVMKKGKMFFERQPLDEEIKCRGCIEAYSKIQREIDARLGLQKRLYDE
jgi:hypothetical protein